MLAFLSIVGVLGQEKITHGALVLDYLQTREGKTNRDVVPSAIWALYARPAMAAAAITQRTRQGRLGMSYMGSGIFGQNLSRARTRRVALAVGSPDMELLATSDVYWDRIAEISPDGEDEVFDMTVKGLHNFVASNIILHNSIEQDADVVMFLFRPEYYKSDEKPGIAEVHVAKHRNGPTGTIELKFRRDHTRFYNLETRRPEPGTE
jgi:replicative DNA helicase